MRSDHLKKALKFCCVIDDMPGLVSLTDQVRTALAAGATMIRYSGSAVEEEWRELHSICRLCQSNRVPFMLLDQVLPARAMGADGVHLEDAPISPETARTILGPEALIGKGLGRKMETVPLSPCIDYHEGEASHLGTAPAITRNVRTPEEARRALELGTAGISVPGTIFESADPAGMLNALGRAAGCSRHPAPSAPWQDEFGLIEKILKQAPNSRSGIIVPPGDDAALLSPLSRPVISTDTQKEGVHFRRDWQMPEEIGEKAVSVTLSDLAASYALPVSLFVNLSLPASVSDAFVEDLYRGIRRALEGYGCSLGGGNISAGEVLSIDLFAIGDGRDVFPKRSEAKPGFNLYTTGPLGVARAGLEALLTDDCDFPRLVHRFKHPRARFDAAEVLASHGVSCVMDISDGLSGDAAHMARASGLTIELDTTHLLHPEILTSFCRKYRRNPDALALAGGEDYELLFACPPEIFPDIKSALPETIRVGHCLTLQERHVITPDMMTLTSYRHGV